MSSRSIYCTFYLDDTLFGIEIRRVEEVLLNLPITRVPLASRMIEGLINLRGQILIALNLRKVLIANPIMQSMPQTNIVVNSAAGLYSLLADRYGDVVELDPDRFESPTPTLNRQLRSRLHSVYQFEDRILHLLDLDPLLDHGDR